MFSLPFHSSDTKQDVTYKKIRYAVNELLLIGDKRVWWVGIKYKQDNESPFDSNIIYKTIV